MALRCPECGGRGYSNGLNGTLHCGRGGDEVARFFGEGPCSVCHGTGWRIPPALPEKVKQRHATLSKN